MAESVAANFSRHAVPEQPWNKFRTNNPLEQMMRENPWRNREVGAFPDAQICLNLAAVGLRRIADSKWSSKRYLKMDLLKQIETKAGPTTA